MPQLENVKGFIAYYWIDAGEGIMASPSVFEDKAGADESVKFAHKWIEEPRLISSRTRRGSPRATLLRATRSRRHATPLVAMRCMAELGVKGDWIAHFSTPSMARADASSSPRIRCP
jgi:hypothetical protein